MKKYIFSIMFCCATFVPVAMSQSAIDVLRFSQYYSGGTARSVSMGGAFGALGGDLSVLSTNPAGLGLYRGSEFTFTPAMNFTRTDADFHEATFREKNFRFNINNLGYVYTWNLHNPKGFQSISLGLAYNRLSDFAADAYVDVPRGGSSQLDEFAWNASGGVFRPAYEELAAETQAIWQGDGTTEYYNDYMINGDEYNQRLERTMKYRGGIGEYAISAGANISDMFYIGLTWGIHDVYYEEFYSHVESPNFEYLDYYTFNSNYFINGWGMNGKLGLIYRPISMLRLGLAVHTPTYYWLTSEMDNRMDAFYNKPPLTDSEDDYFWAESPLIGTDFKISTPWRYNASAAVVIGSFGLVSMDAEFVNYSKNEAFPNKDFSDINYQITNGFKSTVNLKAGAEAHIGPVFLRGGMAYYGSPYEDDFEVDGAPMFSEDVTNKATFSYSGGLGFRARNFYIDAAYSYTQFPKHFYDMYYNPEGNEIVTPVLQKINNKVVFTFGFKF